MLDELGLPGVNVITSAFVGASETQLDALGFDGATVAVPHPVQNLTTAELHRLADGATDEILATIGEATVQEGLR